MSRFIQRLKLRNLLSFRDCEIELSDLNVLIGPNGAGKSNLIEVLDLIHSYAGDFPRKLVSGGGVDAWVWKGDNSKPGDQVQIELTVHIDPVGPLRHFLGFRAQQQSSVVDLELLETGQSGNLFRLEAGQYRLNEGHNGASRAMPPGVPLLNQYTPAPESGIIRQFYERLHSIVVYRTFNTNEGSPMRKGYANVFSSHLLPEGDNLALFLNELSFHDRLPLVEEQLRELGSPYTRIKPRSVSGFWRLVLQETGLSDGIPGERISDGTLRFLCLAAICLDPDPPPLVCIEEPEAGLHPDSVRLVARMLKDASERTQLVVTTHSKELIDELSGSPEDVVVCEKDFDNATECRRLDAGQLSEWLTDYSLGELWRKGEIGGNRW